MNIKAKTYATTLWESLQQKTQSEIGAYIDSLTSFFSAYQKDKSVRDFFAHPHIEWDKKQKVLIDFFASNSLGEQLEQFVSLLLRENKMDILRKILTLLQNKKNETFNTVAIEVTVAHALSATGKKEMIEQLSKIFDQKNIQLSYSIDENLLGGAIYDIEGTRIDASLQSKLSKIRTTLVS